jgi:putative spermidine/putrescine transport system ATP-binding protein
MSDERVREEPRTQTLRQPTSPAAGTTHESGSVAVELVGLTKRYGPVTAVSGVDLTVQQGELIAVLGASGSGKTTLLRMMAGFETITEGAIRLFGRDVSRLSPADREIGMVFQNYALMPHLTVRKNIEYGLRMRGWSRADRRSRVTEMLERMRLQEYGDRVPRQLSGGQQQRVAIARALAYSPKLLLMDEPMGALDKALKQELLAEIRRVHREFSTTIFYVTHDREEALTLADRVALMADSRLMDCSPVRDMYLRPRTRLAAEFFADANVLPVEVIGSAEGRTTVRLSGVEHSVSGSARSGSAYLALRPRDIHFGSTGQGWTLSATVEDTVFLGDDVRMTVTPEEVGSRAGPLTLLVPLAVAGSVAVGDRVQLGIDAAAAHLIDDPGEELTP